jgi:hypothetical protein
MVDFRYHRPKRKSRRSSLILMALLVPAPRFDFLFPHGKLYTSKVFCVEDVFFVAVCFPYHRFRLLRIFCFNLDGHAKGFFDFHLIGFHKSKASFLDFWAKEKGADSFSTFSNN